MIDPIVEEIHKIREEYAEKFDYDIDAMFEDLRQKQFKNDRKIETFTKDKRNAKNIKEKKVA